MAPGTPALGDPRRLELLDRADLGGALRPLLEDAGPLVDRLAGRSFDNWETVVDAAQMEVAAMDDEEKAQLLQAHPRIGERMDVLRARSAISLAEQGGGIPISQVAQARMDELNAAYEARFGFPFVEFVAGRPRDQLIRVMEMRLARTRAEELGAGCDALLAIARDRLRRSGR